MSERITAQNVDLSNCDRELIQFPSAILPHGILLTVSEPEFVILQASHNAAAFFGCPLEQLLQLRLPEVLDEHTMQAIRDRLQKDSLQGPPTRLCIMTSGANRIHVLGHRLDQVLILEFEPDPAESMSVPDLYAELRDSAFRLHSTQGMGEFLSAAVLQIRGFTGFDRVMAYRFLPDGSGHVVAESVIPGQPPYLGLHYPASDIPAPSRRLFSMSWLRHQPDISYIPVPIVPEINPLTGGPLDLSYAILRSVSVMYTGYLKNMGTTSSMVMSLLKEGRLWGLIACHHHSGPKHVPYEVRLACEFLANMVSLLISEKQEREFADYRLKLKSTQEALVQKIARTGEFTESLIVGQPNLLDFVHADGAAVVIDNKIFSIGKAPSEVQIRLILEWLLPQQNGGISASDCLSSAIPAAESFKDTASGVLALRFAAAKHDYLLWFRPEVIHTVDWAGDPHKPVDLSDDGQRLMPRGSFALWKETVRLKSSSWSDIEKQASRDLRVALLEVVLRSAEQIGDLYSRLEQSYIELDSFAYVASHDLKEPLRGIHNYSRFLLEDCAAFLREEDTAKLEAMVRLSHRMENLLDALLQYSRMSRRDLSPQTYDFNVVVKEVLDNLQLRLAESNAEIRIPQPLPSDLKADAVALSAIFSNLISNALKYNDKPRKWVEIGSILEPPSRRIFYVRDNGIGVEPEHLENIFIIFRRLHGPGEFGGGTGAGLTIARKLVERHGGRLWVESVVDEGSTFYFTLQEAN